MTHRFSQNNYIAMIIGGFTMSTIKLDALTILDNLVAQMHMPYTIVDGYIRPKTGIVTKRIKPDEAHIKPSNSVDLDLESLDDYATALLDALDEFVITSYLYEGFILVYSNLKKPLPSKLYIEFIGSEKKVLRVGTKLVRA